MMDLLFKRKYSKPVFFFVLLTICLAITLSLTYWTGETILNYLIGGMFWVAGRHFYGRFDGIINPVIKPDEPKEDD